MFTQHLQSPLGAIRINATATGICEIAFIAAEDIVTDKPSSLTRQATEQLQQYFAGTLTRFTLPLCATGTDFQKSVWQQLCAIGYGETCSYGAVATALKNPKAVRAVGAANGRNPIGIVVPCHRVIGANGTLTGYAGGLDKKAWLLAHEKKVYQSL